MPPIDLHCHTTASDGRLAPAGLVAHAAERGIEVIAVTDHDTVDGIDEALGAADVAGMRVICGIELSSVRDGRNIHVLGWFLDPRSPVLAEALVGLRAERRRRGEAIVARLNELGFELSIEQVRAEAGSAVIGRPHVARALVAAGYVASVSEAFAPDLLADGGRADVAKRVFDPVEAVRLVGAAGGVAAIAHHAVAHHAGPARGIDRALIEELRDAGMAAIEVDHPNHDPAARDAMRALAIELDLVATGGSDFHGDTGQTLGLCTTEPEALEALQERRTTAGG